MFWGIFQLPQRKIYQTQVRYITSENRIDPMILCQLSVNARFFVPASSLATRIRLNSIKETLLHENVLVLRVNTNKRSYWWRTDY